MARKKVLVLTGMMGVAAVAAGAYVARHRRAASAADPAPVAPAARTDSDAMAQEFGDDEVLAVR